MEGIIVRRANRIVDNFNSQLESNHLGKRCGTININDVFVDFISGVIWELSTGKDLADAKELTKAVLKFEVLA